jgi:CHAD domain-containing protein
MEPDYIKLKNIKPALSGYLKESVGLLDLAAVPDDRIIHDVRVFMKKSRAVMKLVAGSYGSDFFNREYGTFREVGRILSSWRESSVHRKTLRELKKIHPSVFKQLAGNPKIDTLMKKADQQAEPEPEMKEALEKIRELIYKSSYRIRFQTMNGLNPEILLQELERSYLLTAEKYLTSRNSLKPADIHEFRKRAKDFLYQLWFFRPVNPPAIKSLEKKLDTLTQNLGKFNDLDQLIRSLEYKYSADAALPAMDELIIMVRQEQDRYISKVWSAAWKIFRPGRPLESVLGFKVLKL